ncbi:MAG TPA: hypothetical protein VGC64_07155 [Pyrinomonadaceae bacterium]|jgi:hypothetical protein
MNVELLTPAILLKQDGVRARIDLVSSRASKKVIDRNSLRVYICSLALLMNEAKAREEKRVSMLTNLTTARVKRGTVAAASWPLGTGMPGGLLSAYCLDSITTDLSFDGHVPTEDRTAETQAISNSRQLQL